ncbi:MAG: hypothetical protein M0035_16945, partial [Actinomycetota bacterium]|nr:hypothetical protein [Actinomycetota bacterium]
MSAKPAWPTVTTSAAAALDFAESVTATLRRQPDQLHCLSNADEVFGDVVRNPRPLPIGVTRKDVGVLWQHDVAGRRTRA